MFSKDDLLKDAHALLARNNAQAIREALAKLEERRPVFRTRWLWELLQNAHDVRDAGRPLRVEVSIREGQLDFKHNGRPFKRDEALSLIFHGSTKPGVPGALGRFGTGFLSTHLLSRIVDVSGTLKEPDESRGFEFTLDRSGSTDKALDDAMTLSRDKFFDTLAAGDIQPSEWTSYRYFLQDESKDLADSLEPYASVLPWVLTLDISLSAVTFATGQAGNREFARESETLTDQLTLVAIRDGEAVTSRYARYTQGEIVLCIQLATTERRVLRAAAGPRLFIHLPLVATTNMGLPVAIHSESFAPTDDRDGIHFEASDDECHGPKSQNNLKLLQSAAAAYLALAKYCADSGWQDLHELLRVQALGPASWLGDTHSYRKWQAGLLEGLFQLPLLLSTANGLVPPAQAIIPLAESSVSATQLHLAASSIFADRLPKTELATVFAEIAKGWFEVLGADHPILQRIALSTSKLLDVVRSTKTLAGLATRISGTVEQAIAWLNATIAMIPETERSRALDGVLPDQEGTFKLRVLLRRDGGIAEEIKDALEALSDPIRSTLLHKSILGADALVAAPEKVDLVAARLKDLLKKAAKTRPANVTEQKFKAACLLAFKWFSVGERWPDLKDGFPLIVMDHEGADLIRQTAAGDAKFLLPSTLWPDKAQSYWDAFPPGSVLSKAYGESLPSALWPKLDAARVVKSALLQTKEIDIDSVELLDRYLAADQGIDDDEEQHEPPDGSRKCVIGVLALVGDGDFYEALRKSKERAARFLAFILDYVVEADASWKVRTELSCDCKRAQHEIIPCDWLGWIRRVEWVPRTRNHADRLTTASAGLLARKSDALRQILLRDALSPFLEIVGINVLEQRLLDFDAADRPEIRRRLAQIAGLCDGTDAFNSLVKVASARKSASSRWNENQLLGKTIEKLIRELLSSNALFDVKPRFVGCDLEVYLRVAREDEQEVEVGRIELGGTLVEIKATWSDVVSMSSRQGEAATAAPNRFWLCVVHLQAGDDAGKLGAGDLETRAHFVKGIGDVLAAARSELGEAVKAARAEGVELEHLDEVRYRVKRELWVGARAMAPSAFIASLLGSGSPSPLPEPS